MKVLVVGGAGYVGSILRAAMDQEHDCRWFDIVPTPDVAAERVLVGDVNDDAVVARAVEGMDAVVYLAMGRAANVDPVPAAINDISASFAVNAAGPYRFLSHGLRGSMTRFVYVSSLSVYERLTPARKYVDESEPPDAFYPYAITKRLGEEVCRAAAQRFPQAIITALRLVLPKNDQDWPVKKYKSDGLASGCAIGPNDTRRLFLAALACDKPGCHILQCSGDLSGKKIPNTRAREILGWTPQGN